MRVKIELATRQVPASSRTKLRGWKLYAASTPPPKQALEAGRCMEHPSFVQVKIRNLSKVTRGIDTVL